jgi:hypothetical protein
MAKRPRDSVEREIMDIIPERFDADSENLGERRGGHTRLILTIALGLLALAAVGVAARHLLVGDGPRSVADANVPVIKPDDKPIKTKPEDRGGMAVPNQDKLVYQDLGKGDKNDEQGTTTEKLLPPPEKPQAPAMKQDSASSAMPPPPAAAGNDIPAPPNNEAPPAKAAPVEKVTSASPTPNTAATQTTALSPVKETGKKMAMAESAKKEASASPVPNTQATALATGAPKAAAKASAGGSGNFQIQLAAMKSEGEAMAAWKKAQAANKDLLGGLSPDIVRADLGAKGVYYRVRAGAYEEADAKTLCAQLTAHKQGCIVAKK